jgi:bacterioferritin
MDMKGEAKVIGTLNQLLADELTAISQYMVHSEMCDNWGFGKLHKAIEKQAIDEMHHAEWLIGRIIFLEGTPVVSKLNPLKIGKTVPEMVANDKEAELGAVHAYNAGVRVAVEIGDEASADLMRKILKDEESHEDWNEAQQDQIDQMGLENYLSMQTNEGG